MGTSGEPAQLDTHSKMDGKDQPGRTANRPNIPPSSRRRPPLKFGQVPTWMVLGSMGFAVFSIISTMMKHNNNR